MISRKKIVLTTAAILLSMAGSGFALDLSSFQSFLSGNRGKAKATQPTRTFTDLGGQNEYSKNYRSLNADASYREYPGELVTLGGNRQLQDGERYLLPPETRVPKELRPILSERKTPRQGLSLAGGSGATLVPSPGILEPGKSSVSIHAMTFDLYNVNGVKYKDQDYFDTTVCIAYGVEDGAEVSFDKTFANQDRYDIAEPLYFNAKYQVPGNVTIGGSFCTDSNAGYHSVWIGAGVPVAWVAVGANFGASNYKFSYNGYDRLKRAKFGGYNYHYDTAEGYADPVFFLVGGAVPLNDNLRFVYDFNGDRFSLGFRFNYQNSLYLDASYVSDGDYENLPGAIAHKRMNNFVFGGSLAY
ncbi:MAG: hypothetical protein Kow0029_07100 [Candidatus Rifleibacteriota bacterium]